MSGFDSYGYGRPRYDWVWPGVYERTKEEYPYAYSAHYIKGNAETAKGCSATYSDRLRQWDHDKYRECTSIVYQTHTGSDYCWRNMTLEQCSKWMSLFYSKKIQVCAIAEECHQGNGYPIWIIFHKDV